MPPRKRQPALFVDTKSTCFLCLQQVVTKYNGEGQEEKQEPFCLRSIFKLLQLDPTKIFNQNQVLEPLIEGDNLLKSDISAVFCPTCLQVVTQVSSLFSQWEVLQMKLDFAVCNFAEILHSSEMDPKVMAEFRSRLLVPGELLQRCMADLIRKEALKKCTEHLKPCWPIMPWVSDAEAEKDVTSGITTPEVVSYDISASNTGTVSEDRPATVSGRVAKAAFRTQSSTSKAKVAKVIKHPTDKSTSSVTGKKVLSEPGAQIFQNTCTACGSHFTTKCSLVLHKQQHCEFRPGGPRYRPFSEMILPAFPTLTDLLNRMPRTSGEDGEDARLCVLCSSQNNNQKFTQEGDLVKHIFTHHPNYFFASVKRPDCSDARFQELCETVLENELLPIGNGQHERYGFIFSCNLCPSTCKDKWAMYTHITNDHRDICTDKLMELQCADDRSSAMNLKNESVGDRKKSHSLTQRTHSLSTAVLQSRTTEESRQESPKVSTNCNPQTGRSSTTPKPSIYCKDYGKVYTRRCSLLRHRKSESRYPNANQRLSMKNKKSQNAEVLPQTGLTCQNCAVEFDLESNLLEHIDTCHQKKRKRNLDDGKVGDRWAGLRQHIRRKNSSAPPRKDDPTETVVANGPTENGSDDAVGNEVPATCKTFCEFCGYTLARVSSLFRHQRRCVMAKKSVTGIRHKETRFLRK